MIQKISIGEFKQNLEEITRGEDLPYNFKHAHFLTGLLFRTPMNECFQ